MTRYAGPVDHNETDSAGCADARRVPSTARATAKQRRPPRTDASPWAPTAESAYARRGRLLRRPCFSFVDCSRRANAAAATTARCVPPASCFRAARDTRQCDAAVCFAQVLAASARDKGTRREQHRRPLLSRNTRGQDARPNKARGEIRDVHVILIRRRVYDFCFSFSRL